MSMSAQVSICPHIAWDSAQIVFLNTICERLSLKHLEMGPIVLCDDTGLAGSFTEAIMHVSVGSVVLATRSAGGSRMIPLTV